jgi:hypothetical protein
VSRLRLPSWPTWSPLPKQHRRTRANAGSPQQASCSVTTMNCGTHPRAAQVTSAHSRGGDDSAHRHKCCHDVPDPIEPYLVCFYSSKLVVVAKLVRLGGFHSCTCTVVAGWPGWLAGRRSSRRIVLCRWFLACTRFTRRQTAKFKTLELVLNVAQKFYISSKLVSVITIGRIAFPTAHRQAKRASARQVHRCDGVDGQTESEPCMHRSDNRVPDNKQLLPHPNHLCQPNPNQAKQFHQLDFASKSRNQRHECSVNHRRNV